MDEDVKSFSVKFIETTGRWADLELFNEEDAWAFIGDLLTDFAQPRTKLSDGQIIVLRNLGAALGMRPGSSLAGYSPALERNFGPSPMSAADVRTVVLWVYEQVNGGGDFEPAKRPPVALTVGEVGERYGVPRKRR